MAVYRPTRNGKASKFYVCEFVYQGKRFQESTASTSKTVAREYEKRRRDELERAAAGLPTEQKARRIRTVADVITPYVSGYRLTHRPKSVLFVKSRLEQVKKKLGNVILSDLTDECIRGYMRKRQADGVSGRTINMEIGELSRAIGRTWRELWPRVKKFEERKDVGRAISPDEQERLLKALKDCRTPHLPTLVPLLLLTGMRVGEALSLTWGQIDWRRVVITVGRAKTSNGTGREIPINDDLARVLGVHMARFAEAFGELLPSHFLFPWGERRPSDPTRQVSDIKHAWAALLKRAEVRCRLHDLRHTFATRLAENGVPESTMLALLGHVSRAMLERYSHIRLVAKRDAISTMALPTSRKPQEEASQLNPVPVEVPVTVPMTVVH